MALLEIRGKASVRKAAGGGQLDTYVDKLVKLIPAEIVAIYLVGLGQIPKDLPPNQMIALPAWTFICFVLVIVTRIYYTKDPGIFANGKIVCISAISFIIWAYSLGGPFQAYNLYIPWIGSLMILVWTFIAPKIYGDE
ncbi:MAG: hypothetical protein NTZ39_04290 [Methanoregula sp.]|nr:hypothetical protein [Methanoregula sp.]